MVAAHSFWVYLLRVRSGRTYVGCTSVLRQRLADHAAGRACRTTALDPPVALLLAEPYPSLASARAREDQIKGWTRAKKEALIAGDVAALRAWAACRHARQ